MYIGLGYFISTFPSFFTPIIGGKIADFYGYQKVFWVSFGEANANKSFSIEVNFAWDEG